MSESAPLRFLPQPRSIRSFEGSFTLDANVPISIAAIADTTTVRSAQNLQAALTLETGLTLAIQIVEQAPARSGIVLVVAGRDEEVFPPDHLGWTFDPGLGDQAYVLHVRPGGVIAVAADEPGLFYAVQTLIQLTKLTGRIWPALSIEDRPALPVRGLMLDVSRGKVPTLDTLERLVRTLAHYKYNQLQLYTEHTFHFPRHPEIGAGADPLTADDILHLNRVCQEVHIDLVPNLQSLGHQRKMLSLPEYEHLAETPWKWSLATSQEETYQLLDELYGDMLPAFTSRWLNVDADEPWDLGRGQSLSETERIGIGRVYLEHILRLRDLAAKHGRQMMMWADVLKYHPELTNEIPDDIVLLDWWYEPRESYESVEKIAQARRRFYVCPGTSSWSALFPRLESSVKNVETFVRNGIAAGAEGMLLTDWGDGGHFQPLSHSWYPYLWAAECAWSGSATPREQFEESFSLLFFGDGSGQIAPALYRLGTAMRTDDNWVRTWNSAMALWEEPLAGPVADVVKPSQTAEAKAAAQALLPLLSQISDYGIRHDLGFAIHEICFAVDKVETTRALRTLLRELAIEECCDVRKLAQLDGLIASVRKQRDTLPALINEFEIRWMAHARRSEIHINLDRFDRLVERYDAAVRWLEEQRKRYVDGRGVDGNLTTYDTEGYAVFYQETINNIQELVNIIGFEAIPPDIRRWVTNIELTAIGCDAG